MAGDGVGAAPVQGGGEVHGVGDGGDQLRGLHQRPRPALGGIVHGLLQYATNTKMRQNSVIFGETNPLIFRMFPIFLNFPRTSFSRLLSSCGLEVPGPAGPRQHLVPVRVLVQHGQEYLPQVAVVVVYYVRAEQPGGARGGCSGWRPGFVRLLA